MKKEKSIKWEHVGSVTVDAGVIQLGDPCYGYDDQGKWVEFLKNNEILDQGEKLTYPVAHGADRQKGNYKEHAQAIVVSSGYGDGVYPVEVKKKDGMIKEVRIRFF